MSTLSTEPRRWKEERAQASFAERTAGETLRSLPQPEPLTASQLARIAARVRAVQPRRAHRLVFVAVGLLLGVATAASAAHLDILPSWISPRSKRITSVAHDSPKVRAGRKARVSAEAQVANQPLPATDPVRDSATTGAENLPGASAPGVAAEQVAEQVAMVGGGAGSEAGAARQPAAAGVEAHARATATAPAAPVTGRHFAPPLALQGGRRALAKSPVAAGSMASETDDVVVAAPVSASGNTAVPSPPTIAPLPEGPARQPLMGEAKQTVAAPESAAVPSTAPAPQVAKASDARPEGKRSGGAARLFSDTVRMLRTEHDPKAALALLDRQGAELARAGFGHEALLLRVEALLDLGKDDEVLRLLDGASLVDVAASHALLLTRGRLRATANRCADGVGDFSLVLAESRQPDRLALFGRAVCRKQLGDQVGARADLERYRREFPADPRLPELERRVGPAP